MSKIQIIWSKLLPLDETVILSQSQNAGVYRLSYKSADGSYYVFYVGSTEASLRDVLLKHITEDEKNECIKTTIKNLECYFRVAEVSNSQDRISIVRTMIEYFKPKCNPPQTATGEVIEVNLS